MIGNTPSSAPFPYTTLSLTVTTVGNGSVTKNPNQATYNHGTVVQLTATPDPGNAIVGWSGDATGSTSPTSITMDGSKNVTATFTYTLTATTVGTGTRTKSPT